jgi:hypothetical protein
MAFATGGLSLIPTVISIGTSVIGTATNVATDLIDNKTTKKYLEEINGHLQELVSRSKELESKIKNYNDVIENLKKRHGLNDDTAVLVIKKFVEFDSRSAKQVGGIIGGAVNFAAAGKAFNAVKAMEKFGRFVKLPGGGTSFIINQGAKIGATEIAASSNYARVKKFQLNKPIYFLISWDELRC